MDGAAWRLHPSLVLTVLPIHESCGHVNVALTANVPVPNLPPPWNAPLKVFACEAPQLD